MSQSYSFQGIMLLPVFGGTAFQSQGPDEDFKELLRAFPVGSSSNRSCQPLSQASVPFPVKDAMVKDRSLPGPGKPLIRENGSDLGSCQESPASKLHPCHLWTACIGVPGFLPHNSVQASQGKEPGMCFLGSWKPGPCCHQPSCHDSLKSLPTANCVLLLTRERLGFEVLEQSLVAQSRSVLWP